VENSIKQGPIKTYHCFYVDFKLKMKASLGHLPKYSGCCTDSVPLCCQDPALCSTRTSFSPLMTTLGDFGISETGKVNIDKQGLLPWL